MHTYRNGNYVVMIMDDGTKIRHTQYDKFAPAFAENCDVKITDRCDGGCPFCYEGCSLAGKHADLFKYPFINALNPYTELALNGNDLTHPGLERFLEHLKAQKVFANLTVNQKHFMKHYDVLRRWEDVGLIHGLGVSLNDVHEGGFLERVGEFPNAVIHTINGILTMDDCKVMKGRGLKVLVLGYKELKRGVTYLDTHDEEVAATKQALYDGLGEIIHDNWFTVISFDNLALEQLNVKRLLKHEEWESFYMGDDGDFTFYIDMVAGTYAKNSISQDRYPIGNKTINEMFADIISKHK